MSTLRRFLVAIDPNKESQPALTRTLQFVGNSPVTIKLLSCVYAPSLLANNFLSPQQLAKTKASVLKINERKLQKLTEQHASSLIKYEIEAIWHTPIYLGILKVVETFKPDLLIKATHPHTVIARRFFTPTDWQLLKSCPVPALFVKHAQWPGNATVLAALDPSHNLNEESELDKRILKSAFEVAKQLNIPLHACHCFDPDYWDILLEAIGESGQWADVFSGNPDKDESRVLDKLRDEHNQQFAQECAELIPNSANQHLISGEIGNVLPQTLRRLHAGILVLGTTYRTGLLGSSAQRLLETVESDLLVIKPKDFEFFV
ncbi:MAG: universal stress protein E [Paraglaciecola sp.]|jgi:universal stress protein E